MTATLQDRPQRIASPRRRGPGMLMLPEVRWAGLAVLLFALGGALQLSAAPAWAWWTAYLLCYAAGGWEPGWAGLTALRSGTLDVDLLMVVAAVVAASIGQVLDGGLLIVIFATSGALEALATKRTRDSVTALLDLAPEQATVLEGGRERIVPASELRVGDLILVRPGERIGGDGEVVEGASDVDQSSITGEPMPAAKQVGSEVFAGTLNGAGALRVRVTRSADDAVVARIVALVAEASETKAAAQLFVEKIEQRYSIAMVGATLLLFFVPLAAGAELEPTLLRAITFMIVASPCAVVLATMPPLLSAIANAGRHGVLVKSAVAMEQLGSVDTAAFDKTGTLTSGRPAVSAVLAVKRPDAHDPERALTLAASAEQLSEHPLGGAIVRAARDRGLPLLDAVDFQSIPGSGVRAVIDGCRVEVLAPRALPRGTAGAESALALAAPEEQAGGTAVVAVIDGAASAVICLQDQLRDDAAAAVAELAELSGRPPVLLTGDSQRAAEHLGALAGISDARGALLPQDKVAAVRGLERDGRRVLLVGDGVNDAPALAAATASIAMGRHGSDLALETADAVIVRDELAAVPVLIRLSRRARRLVVANLCIAGTVIAVLVCWDLFGALPLPLGVAGHEGSTVAVGLNGLRLLRRAAWR